MEQSWKAVPVDKSSEGHTHLHKVCIPTYSRNIEIPVTVLALEDQTNSHLQFTCWNRFLFYVPWKMPWLMISLTLYSNRLYDSDLNGRKRASSTYLHLWAKRIIFLYFHFFLLTLKDYRKSQHSQSREKSILNLRYLSSRFNVQPFRVSLISSLRPRTFLPCTGLFWNLSQTSCYFLHKYFSMCSRWFGEMNIVIVCNN